VIEIILYQQNNGRCPFNNWFSSLRDKMAQARIMTRLRQVEAGNLGDCASVGDLEQVGSSSSAEETSPLKPRTYNGQKSSGPIGRKVKMKNPKNCLSYNEWEIKQLQSDRELAIEYLKAAMEALDNPEERAGGLLALRAVAEAYGGLGAVAAAADISRESLYRALSPKGNPTLKTLVAVLKTVGLRLSIAEVPQTKARKTKSGRGYAAA
jgi:probable addiction module antidote protein